jgi:hypothetical protein
MPCHQWIAAVAACALLGTAARAQDKDATKKEAAPKPAAGQGGSMLKMGSQLIEGLKKTPGCLGVETAMTGTGKQVIFAFFEDKKAASNWYYSPVHQQLMDLMEPDRDKNLKPMRKIPDGVPVMALASISFKGKPAIKDSPIPFSQIAIEMYTPLSGGINVGGSFAPEAFLKLTGKKPAADPAK